MAVVAADSVTTGTVGSTKLNTSREPTAGRKSPKSIGEEAFTDALIIVGVSWVILFGLAFSLRRFNV